MDNYVYMITALLPLAAAMLVFQVNPYHALVIRGVLGAIAALVYTVLGAPDVALTEALVGTLLAVTLYAVAVRSSLVFRLGVLQEDLSDAQDHIASDVTPLQQVVNGLNTVFKDYHLRVELISYFDRDALQQALMNKEVHAICERGSVVEAKEAIAPGAPDSCAPDSCPPPYRTTTRLRRLYDIMNSELLSSKTQLSYIDHAAAGEVAS